MDPRNIAERRAMRRVINLVVRKNPLKGMEMLENGAVALDENERAI